MILRSGGSASSQFACTCLHHVRTPSDDHVFHVFYLFFAFAHTLVPSCRAVLYRVATLTFTQMHVCRSADIWLSCACTASSFVFLRRFTVLALVLALVTVSSSTVLGQLLTTATILDTFPLTFINCFSGPSISCFQLFSLAFPVMTFTSRLRPSLAVSHIHSQDYDHARTHSRLTLCRSLLLHACVLFCSGSFCSWLLQVVCTIPSSLLCLYGSFSCFCSGAQLPDGAQRWPWSWLCA